MDTPTTSTNRTQEHSDNNPEVTQNALAFSEDISPPQEKRASVKVFKNNKKQLKYIDNSNSLLSLSALALHESQAYSARLGINKYKKQVLDTRIANYHRRSVSALRTTFQAAEEQRLSVIRRVAPQLWTNFCVQGQETHMLSYLHEKLREEFGEDLEFLYIPDCIEVMICRILDDEVKPVEPLEKITILNKAWQLAKDLVDSYTTPLHNG